MTDPTTYERIEPVVRAPLDPPLGYSSPPQRSKAPGLTAPPVNSSNDGTMPPSPDGWRASPRWAAIQGDGCIEVEPEPRAGAGKVKVETCPKDGPETNPRGEVFTAPPQ